jgi:riboflavin kinase/FMN adenylyltransferase
LDTRVDELHSAGAEHVMVLQFTDELRRLPPLDFLLLLKKKLPDLASITVGENFRFGFNRAGDATLLSDFKNRYGISGIRVPRLEDKFGPISSSRLRGLLSNGDFSTTERLLGRAWHLEGKIIRGDQIGRTLGFPTANFSVNGLCLPPYGVYQCRAWIGKSHYGAVVNLGVRPTLGLPPSPRGEAHLLGFDGDVYGQQMKLTDWKFLRPEMRFANLDELKSQISQDVKTAQRLFQE